MGKIQMKDGTAQGVAKVRHYEALHEPSKRLYNDPYAKDMYPGSFVQRWLGIDGIRWVYNVVGAAGVLEMLSIRTRWLDEEIVKAASSSCQQYLILGAGYDMRGYRLADRLPKSTTSSSDGFVIWEVDQPEVQRKKLRRIERIAKTDAVVAERMDSAVRYVPVNFNTDSLDAALRSTDGYTMGKKTVVTLEGVTQYIPKESTAETLTKLKNVVAPGSVVLISYVDQNVWDEPQRCGPVEAVEAVPKMANSTGEAWISGWHPAAFKAFLLELGFEVLSDTTAKDYNEAYLEPLGRGMAEEEIISLERFVVATLKT